MSEYEQPERAEREPTVEDVRALMGASTPHFALQIRNRIHTLVAGLADGHPARVLGEREIERLNRIAVTGEVRGPDEGEPRLPSLKDPFAGPETDEAPTSAQTAGGASSVSRPGAS